MMVNYFPILPFLLLLLLLLPYSPLDQLAHFCLSDFDMSLETIFIPPTITRIVFGFKFNQPVDCLLPPSLLHLTFGEIFNFPIIHWPQQLSHLTFGYSFNSPVGNLPPSVTHLIFGKKFNQPFNPPPTLKLLFLGDMFTQSIDNLPNSIHTLTTYTTAPINTLPSKLTHFDHLTKRNNLNCLLPLSLTHLHISGNGTNDVDFTAPPADTIDCPWI